MNCARCGRRLQSATVRIKVNGAASVNFGPKCSRLMGLIEPRKASEPRIATRYMGVYEDPAQMELIA